MLTSILSALHPGGWSLEMVEDTLEMIFRQQYSLTESVETETRYDSDRNPNDYTICTVTLKKFDLSRLTPYLLTEDQLALYANYMKNLGNRPDLFPQSAYPNASKKEDYLDYDVPSEVLEDETFASMLAEAEKYLGYPYVWGGSSPATSFDCSGYVSWVINHSGWNVGRLGAKALCNLCTPVFSANARPGDLVFFINTYDAPDPDAPTHCGICRAVLPGHFLPDHGTARAAGPAQIAELEGASRQGPWVTLSYFSTIIPFSGSLWNLV